MSSDNVPPLDLSPDNVSTLDWIRLKQDMDMAMEISGPDEGINVWEKIKTKCRENPFVPIGALATAGALSYGLCFKNGDTSRSQYMMRARVGFQVATLVALCGGVVMATIRRRSKD